MNDGVSADVYAIDTSSLMDWQVRYYPTDVFVTLAGHLDGLVASGRLIAPTLVREEAGAMGSSGLAEWTKANRSMFVATRDLLRDAQTIQSQFPGLRDPKSEYEEADAYVIALARRQASGIVVTQETPAAEKRKPPRSHYIPDVCRELGVPCISLLGLIRRERWKL